MIRINLLPQRETAKRESGKQLVIFFLVLMVAEIIALFYIQHQQAVQLESTKAENAKLNKQLTEIKKRTAEVAALQKKKEDLESQKHVLDQLIEGQSGPVKMLDGLAELLTPLDDPRAKFDAQKRGWNPDWDPKRLWIDHFVENQRRIKITGYARNYDDLAEFVHRLDGSRYFVNVDPKISKVVEVASLGKAKLVSFTIDALGIYGSADVKKLVNGQLGQDPSKKKR